MKKKKSKKKIIIGAAAVLVVAGGVTVAGQRNSKETQIPQVPAWRTGTQIPALLP